MVTSATAVSLVLHYPTLPIPCSITLFSRLSDLNNCIKPSINYLSPH